MSSLYIGGTLEEIIEKVFNPRRSISEEEQFERFREILPYLVVKAREAATERATSWRNFHVGCALYAFKNVVYRAEDRWRIFTGSNIKVAEDSRPVCAEQIAIGAAREAGYDRIIGMVIMGKPQAEFEENNTEVHPTLHPCRECRRVFRDLLVFTPDTLIVTITPDEDIYEIYSLTELFQIHGEEDRKNAA